MAKFVVGSTIVDVELHNSAIHDKNPNFLVSDGKDEWFASGELIVESYTPIDMDAEGYYNILEDNY
jgi:hypothetical protein